MKVRVVGGEGTLSGGRSQTPARQDPRVEQVLNTQILNRRAAIVRITSTAICGSDLHLYNGFMPTMMKGDILDHESMSEVVPFPIACGNCEQCEAQNYMCCENSTPNHHMAEKTCVRSKSPTRCPTSRGSSSSTSQTSEDARSKIVLKP